MDIHDVKDAVSTVVYKPGWKFHVDAAYFGMIVVEVNYDAPNSNREWAPDGYPMPIIGGVRTAFTIVLDATSDTITEDEFDRQVMRSIVAIEIHEAREFYRRSDRDYAAPFHPHRPELSAAWDAFADRNPVA